MHRMMKQALIALTVVSLSNVGVGEATNVHAEPATDVAMSLSHLIAPVAATAPVAADSVSATVDTAFAATDSAAAAANSVTTAFGASWIGQEGSPLGRTIVLLPPPPSLCSPGMACQVGDRTSCGLDTATQCPLGQCVDSACYCY